MRPCIVATRSRPVENAGSFSGYEQDHRNIKRRIRPILGFKSFRTARVVLGGVELIHMIRKGQVASDVGKVDRSPAATFYGLAL